jgi:putative hemolysin
LAILRHGLHVMFLMHACMMASEFDILIFFFGAKIRRFLMVASQIAKKSLAFDMKYLLGSRTAVGPRPSKNHVM